MSDIFDASWSQTDSSNTAHWAENMPPSHVNDSGRIMEGALKRAWCWDHATITSSGTANAQTLLYTVAPSAYSPGILFRFIPGASNTGPTTINVNSIGAIPVYSYATGQPLVGGEISEGIIAVISYDGTHFQLENPVPNARLKIGADMTIYVDGDSGDDSNSGTVGSPLATIQAAYNQIVENVDTGGFQVSINQQGSDTVGLLADRPITGTSHVNLILNGDITTGNPIGVQVVGPAKIIISGNGSVSAASYCLVAQNSGEIAFSGITLNGCTNSQVYSQVNGTMVIQGSYSIGGNAAHHYAVDSAGTITIAASATVTLNGTRTFTTFASAATAGQITADHTLLSFSGSANGSHYFAGFGGGIYTNSGGSSFMPGSTSGSTDGTTFGWYA